ncbi:MAG TPA: hypothetical protein VM935_04235 [Chitinophagaceae bacterium]|nr:hypothetical protein [Chitinophagaceae bacterium]
MDAFAQSVYQLIRNKKGLTLDEITPLADAKDTAVLDTAIKRLIETGYVSFYLGKLYPNIWTVGLVLKGERHAAAEIELDGVTIDDIKKIMTPYEGDPLFFESYPIEEDQKAFFEQTTGIDFDYEHFDYYMLNGFDNSEDPKK